ncbi:MAG: aquaporin family protein [Clostridia bacterium]|jgi:glycerol uptake facilitator protein|nr:aquaporin family protein [Clostridia bacterium]HOM43386.1 MIP/aquaporin family protein [Bacillota bacterium]
MSPFLSELIGAMILIIFGGGVCAAVTLNKSKSQSSGWIVIAVGWGLAVGMAALAAPGTAFNPALTIANAVAGTLDWALVPGIVAGQMLGAIIGATVVWLIYLPHWAITEDKAAKLGVFCTAPAVRDYGKNFLTEMIVTAVLAFMCLAIGANKLVDGLGPMVTAAMITAIGCSLGGPTGYAINPCRDLGPRIAHAILPIAGKGGNDWGYSWVPVFGPIVGAIIGTFLYMGLFR